MIPVSLVEQFILNWNAVPPELFGWRYYRTELGGHAESCFKEVPIWLPPMADPYIIDLLFEFWQEKSRSKKRKKLHKIITELERGLKYMDRNTFKDENVQVNSTALEPGPSDEAKAE
jgi:hypothetical protein